MLNVNNSWEWHFFRWVFLCFFFILEDLFGYLVVFWFWRFSFLVLWETGGGEEGGGGGTFTHKFWALGNIFKKLVGDLIFYYDSTYKFRKKYFQRYLPTWAQLCDQLKELPIVFHALNSLWSLFCSVLVYISLHFLLILLVKLGLCLSMLVFRLLLWKQRIK